MISAKSVCLLVAVCGALSACAGSGSYDVASASCSVPGAVRESPFDSTANPTPGPLPTRPGELPCYTRFPSSSNGTEDWDERLFDQWP